VLLVEVLKHVLVLPTTKPPPDDPLAADPDLSCYMDKHTHRHRHTRTHLEVLKDDDDLAQVFVRLCLPHALKPAAHTHTQRQRSGA
jgi:hypothetical protein